MKEEHTVELKRIIGSACIPTDILNLIEDIIKKAKEEEKKRIRKRIYQLYRQNKTIVELWNILREELKEGKK